MQCASEDFEAAHEEYGEGEEDFEEEDKGAEEEDEGTHESEEDKETEEQLDAQARGAAPEAALSDQLYDLSVTIHPFLVVAFFIPEKGAMGA